MNLAAELYAQQSEGMHEGLVRETMGVGGKIGAPPSRWVISPLNPVLQVTVLVPTLPSHTPV